MQRYHPYIEAVGDSNPYTHYFTVVYRDTSDPGRPYTCYGLFTWDGVTLKLAHSGFVTNKLIPSNNMPKRFVQLQLEIINICCRLNYVKESDIISIVYVGHCILRTVRQMVILEDHVWVVIANIFWHSDRTCTLAAYESYRTLIADWMRIGAVADYYVPHDKETILRLSEVKAASRYQPMTTPDIPDLGFFKNGVFDSDFIAALTRPRLSVSDYNRKHNLNDEVPLGRFRGPLHTIIFSEA